MQGEEIAAALNRHRFLVVPSSYEEAFGIVALEGLACGCVPIVSERGGLVDAIGKHGYVFPNGDDVALADVLARVLSDVEAAHSRLSDVNRHLRGCTGRAVAERYLAIFETTLGIRSANSPMIV
jgi:glycosyltransferase involved in cell wall biosynthesis